MHNSATANKRIRNPGVAPVVVSFLHRAHLHVCWREPKKEILTIPNRSEMMLLLQFYVFPGAYGVGGNLRLEFWNSSTKVSAFSSRNGIIQASDSFSFFTTRSQFIQRNLLFSCFGKTCGGLSTHCQFPYSSSYSFWFYICCIPTPIRECSHHTFASLSYGAVLLFGGLSTAKCLS